MSSIVMQINPFDYFTDLSGAALTEGYIYIGEPNRDPRQYPVSIFYDAALTIPAAQPLRTNNGYVVRNNAPTFLYLNGNYSVLVLDKQLRQVFYVADFLLTGSSGAVSSLDLPILCKSYAELMTFVGRYENDTAETAAYYPVAVLPYSNFDQGQGNYYWSSTDTRPHNGFTIGKPNAIAPASPGRWLLKLDKWATFRQAGAIGDGITVAGNRERIQAALDATVSVHDITGENNPVPSFRLRAGAGTFLIDGRLLATKNNICIDGEGEGNTFIKCANTVVINEVIRFREAYWCELNDITIDGGLPFRATRTETYGADIGIKWDQAAYFRSRNCTVQNVRITAREATHLWESWFNNSSSLSCGWFATAERFGGDWNFTGQRKESTTFPGAESNEIYVDKHSSNCIGSLVICDGSAAPVSNFKITELIGEGRTYTSDMPGLHQDYIYISGMSNGINISGYCYAHAQTFTGDAAYINFFNSGIGCEISLDIYQYSPAGTFVPYPTVIKTSAALAGKVDLTISDAFGGITKFIDAGSASSIIGDIYYQTDITTKNISTMFNGNADRRYSGTIFWQLGDFALDRLVRYTYTAREKEYWSAQAGGALFEISKELASATFNGVTMAIGRSPGFSTIINSSPGRWTLSPTSPLPMNANGVPAYTVVLNGARVNLGDALHVVSMDANSIVIENINHNGASSNTPLVCIQVSAN